MKKRILAAVLACALLAGCGRQAAAPAEEMPEERPVIAYVPLDDRPDNVERVVYLAESVGYALVMPEADLYRTRLDGQPANENGTQYGDLAALYEWVLAQEAAGCDRYMLSMDQLLSGGLVNSRHTAESLTVTLSDGRTMTDTELLEGLLTALAADGNNRVWLLDSVMRLAPTVGYAGFGIEEYNALRAYGAAPRKEASGAELTAEAVTADYRLGSGGTVLEAADFGLTEAQADEYLSARRRKLELADRMLELVSGGEYGNFRVLIGIDDSSEEDSIQKNEIAYLRSRLRQGDALLSGVDDLAFKAVAKLYLEESGWDGRTVQVGVTYFGGTEDKPACDYDYKPLREIVEEHLAFFGVSQLSGGSGAADIELLVLTQPDTEAYEAAGMSQAEQDRQKKNAYTNLIDWLGTLRNRQIPVILIDAGNGKYGNAFQEALTEEAELGYLLSYAGFLDMAIVTGTALSHGVARYAWLCQGNDPNDLANTAFRESLAESLVLDFCYRNTVRNDISAYVRELGGDPNNFYVPPIDTEAVRQKLESAMAKSAKPVLKNLSQSNFITDLAAYRTGDGGVLGWGSMTMENWSFPWQRVFEARPEISAGVPTRPNYSIFERISQVFS